MTKIPRAGFTLVELSIVLVIIGLIVGAILMGTSLYQAAQLQSVISDVNRYKQAVGMFRDKYHSLPGDMSNATDIWGTATSNGDGNGFIDANPNPGGGSPFNMYPGTEQVLAWQHLSLAGMIEGAYDGTTVKLVPGKNIPASRYAPGAFTLFYVPPTAGDGLSYASTYGHIIVFGAVPASALTSMTPSSPVIKAADAQSVDQKIDDGMPATGNVLTYNNTLAPNCVSSNTSTATYLASNINIACALIFITGF